MLGKEMVKNMRRFINIFFLIFIFTINTNSQEILLDTTETAGKGLRIAGYGLLGFAIGLIGMGSYGIVETKLKLHPYSIGVLTPYYFIAAGALGIGSGIFLKIGYDRKRKATEWREKSDRVTFSILIPF